MTKLLEQSILFIINFIYQPVEITSFKFYFNLSYGNKIMCKLKGYALLEELFLLLSVQRLVKLVKSYMYMGYKSSENVKIGFIFQPAKYMLCF